MPEPPVKFTREIKASRVLLAGMNPEIWFHPSPATGVAGAHGKVWTAMQARASKPIPSSRRRVIFGLVNLFLQKLLGGNRKQTKTVFWSSPGATPNQRVICSMRLGNLLVLSFRHSLQIIPQLMKPA